MGAIQNSINGAIGAVAVAGRMIGTEKDSAVSQGASAFQQNKADESELANVEKETSAQFKENVNIQKDINTLDEMRKKPKANGIKTLDDWKAYSSLLGQALDDKQAAQRALDELFNKQEAIKERMARQEAAMAKGRKWGGSY